MTPDDLDRIRSLCDAMVTEAIAEYEADQERAKRKRDLTIAAARTRRSEAEAHFHGTIRCERCGRTTTDPDRWDPDVYTGLIYCDPCWPHRPFAA